MTQIDALPFGLDPSETSNIHFSALLEEKIENAEKAIGNEDSFLSILSEDTQTSFKLGVQSTLEDGEDTNPAQELINSNLTELAAHVFDKAADRPPTAQLPMTKFGEGLKNLLENNPDFAADFGANMSIETGAIEALSQTFEENPEMDSSEFFEPYGEEFAAGMANLPEATQHAFIERALKNPEEFEKFAEDANQDPDFKNITAEIGNLLEDAQNIAPFNDQVLENLTYEGFKKQASVATEHLAIFDENGELNLTGMIDFAKRQLQHIQENLPPEFAEWGERLLESITPLLGKMGEAFGNFSFDFRAEQSTADGPAPGQESDAKFDEDGRPVHTHEAVTGRKADEDPSQDSAQTPAPGLAN